MEVGSTTGFGKNANYKNIFHAEFSCSFLVGIINHYCHRKKKIVKNSSIFCSFQRQKTINIKHHPPLWVNLKAKEEEEK